MDTDCQNTQPNELNFWKFHLNDKYGFCNININGYSGAAAKTSSKTMLNNQ